MGIPVVGFLKADIWRASSSKQWLKLELENTPWVYTAIKPLYLQAITSFQ
jgi:hypothetical protein